MGALAALVCLAGVAPRAASAQEAAREPVPGSPLQKLVPLPNNPEAVISSDIPEGGEASWIERAGRNLFVFFEDLELLNVEKEIDRFVGDPWTLKESTSLKLSLLPFHLRYPLYRTISQGVGQINAPTKLMPQLSGHSFDPSAPPVMMFSSGAGAEAARAMLEELGRFFTPEEILDLGVYLLTKYSFFPQTEEGWHRLKREIADFDVILGLAAVLGGAAADAGTFSHSGRLFNSEKDGFRLGWYGSVRKLGVSLSPVLRAGLTVKAGNLEVSAGGSMQVNGKDTQEKLALESALKYSLIRELSKPGGGWDVFFQASSRHVMTSGEAFRGKTGQGAFGLYGSLSEVFGVPQLGLHASAVIETDYRDTAGYLFNLALENENYNLQALLQFGAKQDFQTGQTSYVAGAYLSGSFESNADLHRSRMNLAGGRVRAAMERIAREEMRIKETEEALAKIGSGHLTVERERELVSRIRGCVAEIERAKLEIAASLAAYFEHRLAYHRAIKAAGKLSDHFGLLNWDEVESARKLSFRTLGDYASLVRARLDEIRGLRETQVEAGRVARDLSFATSFSDNQTAVARKRLAMMLKATDLEIAELNSRIMDARTELTRAYHVFAALRSHARVIARLDVGKERLWPEALDSKEDSSARGLLIPR